MTSAVNKLLKAVGDTPDDDFDVSYIQEAKARARLRRMQQTNPEFFGYTESPPKKPELDAWGYKPSNEEILRWLKWKEDNKLTPPDILQNDSTLNKLLKAVAPPEDENGDENGDDEEMSDDEYNEEHEATRQFWAKPMKERNEAFIRRYQTDKAAEDKAAEMGQEWVDERKFSDGGELLRNLNSMSPEDFEKWARDTVGDEAYEGMRVYPESTYNISDEVNPENEYLVPGYVAGGGSQANEQWDKEHEVTPRKFDPHIQNSALNKLLKAVTDTPDEPDSEDERRRRLQDTEEYIGEVKISLEDWNALTEEEQADHLQGRFAEMTGGQNLDPTTGELMDMKVDSERWEGIKPPKEFPPNVQNDSAVSKLLKGVPFIDAQGRSGILGGGTSVDIAWEKAQKAKKAEAKKAAKQKAAEAEKHPWKKKSNLNDFTLFMTKQAANTKQITGMGTQYGTSPIDPIGRIKEIEPGDYGPDARYHQVDTSSQWGTPDLHSYGYGHEKPDISGESVKPYWEQMNELPTIEEEQEAKQAESPTQTLMNQVLG